MRMGKSTSETCKEFVKTNLRLGLLQEHNVKVGVAADLFRLKIGNLFSRRTVERLDPEVVDALITKSIENAFAIARE